MNTRLVATFMLMMAGACFAQAESAGTVDLRPIWREGQTSRYRVNQTELTRSSMRGVDQVIEAVMEVEAEMTWVVKSAEPDGGGVASLTIDTIKIKMNDGQGNVVNVSDKGGDKGTEAFQQWAAALAGTPVEVTVSPDGVIESVRGHEAIAAKAGPAGEGLDESYFREIAMDTAVLTGGPKDARIGQSWTQQHGSSHQMGNVSYDSTYTLRGVEMIAMVPVAFINRKSRLNFEPDLGDLPADGPKVEVRMTTGDATATLMFDTSRNELVGGNFEQTLELEVTMSFQGRSITRTQREVTSTQLLRIEEK